jgi:hypothetical protein
MKVNHCLGGICGLHLQNQRIGQARSQQKTKTAHYLLHASHTCNPMPQTSLKLGKIVKADYFSNNINQNRILLKVR